MIRMGRIVAQLQRQRMKFVWATWRACLQEMPLERENEHRMRMAMRKIVKCVDEEKRKRTLMNCRVLTRIVVRLVMNIWKHGVEVSKAERAEEKRQHYIMSKFVYRMLHKRLSSAVGQWYRVVQGVTQLRIASNRMRTRLRCRNVTKHFDAWQQYRGSTMRLHTSLGRSMRSLRNLSFIRGLLVPGRVRLIIRSWRDCILQKKHREEGTNLVLAHWNLHIKTKILSAMHDNAMASRHCRFRVKVRENEPSPVIAR